MNVKDKLGLLGATILTLGMGAVATPALAQDAPAVEDEEVIVVTGSRIRRNDLTSAAPIQIITSQSMDERGIVNVAEALNQVPGVGLPVNEAGDQATFATGRNFVNLFNLGSQRTLTLLNGRRFVSSNATQIVGGLGAQGSQVDLNSIPTALIDRIETIQAGGAAVYGSDAIAGVVNIIMREDFEGIEVDGQVGISDLDDYQRERFRVTGGYNIGTRGNIAGSVEWSRSEGLKSSDRERTARNYAFANNPANTSGSDGIPGQILIPDRRVPELSEGGVVWFSNSTNIANHTQYGFAPNGDLVPFNIGNYRQASIAQGGDGFNLATVTALATPIERTLFSVIGHYDITDSIRFSGEVFANHVESTETANQPVYNSSLFAAASGALVGPSVGMVATNPFLSPQAVGVLNSLGLGGAGGFVLQRASTDLVGGANTVVSETDTYRINVGLDGEFTAFGDRGFYWNVAALFGRAEGFFSQPSIVQSRFLNAVNAVSSGGQIVCSINADADPNNNDAACAPLNIFGQGRASQAALDYITTDFRSDFANEQTGYEANIGGELFALPGGMVGFIVGYEFREESGEFVPNDAQRLGIGRSAAIAPVSGEYNTSEFYGEVLVPILGEGFNLPFIQSAEFEGAYRTVDNSQSGKNEAWTMSMRVNPYDDLLLRGTLSQTFRAPSISELFQPLASAFSFATDPCTTTNITGGPNPAARAANCAAAFAALGTPLSGFVTSNVQSASIQILTGGNTSLVPEEARSWSMGFVFRPDEIPGFAIAADYVDIRLENAIENFTLTNIMAVCYDSVAYPSEACSRFTRNSTGQVVAATTGRINAGYNNFQGVTASIEYNRDFEDTWFAFVPGSFGIDLDLFKVKRLAVSATGLSINEDNNRDEIGNSDLEGNLAINYMNGPFRLGWTTRWISDALFDNTFTRETRTPLGVQEYYQHDASFVYDFTDNLTGRFVITNVFDEEPPFGTNGQGVYDLIGRYFFVGATARF